METPIDSRRAKFESIVRNHQRGLWRYLRFLGCGAGDADDLLKETFLSAWKSDFEAFNEQATTSYLQTAAKSHFLNLLRDKGKRPKKSSFVGVETEWEQLVKDGEWETYSDTSDTLEDCLLRIKGKARRAIDLNYRVGLKYAEIAKKLDVTPDDVRSLMKGAVAELRKCYGKEAGLAGRKERLIHLMLREKLGEKKPPDLSAQIMDVIDDQPAGAVQTVSAPRPAPRVYHAPPRQSILSPGIVVGAGIALLLLGGLGLVGYLLSSNEAPKQNREGGRPDVEEAKSEQRWDHPGENKGDNR